jgi:mono/diheme cytochrome c family protein
MMKRIAAALALTLAVAGTAQAADGKALFASKCKVCHDADGKGQGVMGKKLGVKDLTVTTLSAADIEATISKGKGKMTPFAGKLAPDEIKAVAAFVKGGLK